MGMSSMMGFRFVQKCRMIDEFAANLRFKIWAKTANSHQKYRFKLWIMDLSKNGAFYQQKVPCNAMRVLMTFKTKGWHVWLNQWVNLISASYMRECVCNISSLSWNLSSIAKSVPTDRMNCHASIITIIYFMWSL